MDAVHQSLRQGATRPTGSCSSLVAAVLLAYGLAAVPVVERAGWFAAAVIHELGHTAVAWLCGMPAFPTIRLDGHAASVHQAQELWLALVNWGALGLCAMVLGRARVRAWIGFALAALCYPVVAFTWVGDLLQLIGGHLTELVFAGVFGYRGFTRRFTDREVERWLYAGFALFLAGGHALFCARLVTSAAARAEYSGSGSFGGTNDYIRAAELLGWPLESVAAGMLTLSILALPVALSLALRFSRRR